MELRTLLAVIISLIILVFYQYFYAPPPPDKEKEKPAAGQAQVPEKVKGGVEKTPLTPSPRPSEIEAQAGEDVVVDTPLYTAVFDTRGARLKSWKVKKYLDKIGNGAKPIDLATEALSDVSPFGLKFTEANFSFSPETLFQVSAQKLQLAPNQEKGDLQFTWISPEGLRLTQQITFFANSYRMDLALQMVNETSRDFEGRPVLVWSGKSFQASSSGGMSCIPGAGGGTGAAVPPFTVLVKKELQEIEVKDLKEEKRFSQNVQWGGFQDIYFLAALVPKKSEGAELTLKRVSDTAGELQMAGPKASLPPGTQFSQSYTMYLGPKDLDILKAFNNDLDRALDFGWFDIVAKPMLYVMKFFYKYTGNYGLAIIFLTLVIKILF